MVDDRGASTGSNRQAVSREMAQPPQPRHLEERLDARGGSDHRRRPPPPRQPLGRDRKAPPRPHRQLDQEPLELVGQAVRAIPRHSARVCAPFRPDPSRPRFGAKTSRVSDAHRRAFGIEDDDGPTEEPPPGKRGRRRGDDNLISEYSECVAQFWRDFAPFSRAIRRPSPHALLCARF